MDGDEAANGGIDNDIYEHIRELSEIGNSYLEKKEYSKAIEQYHKAFDLIPEPFENYKASTWLLTAIGDTYFLARDYINALRALEEAMYCPKAIGNAFIHLRLGQALFELNNLDKARDELARAYLGGGKEIFEDENPKYYEYLKAFMRNVE
ncbi:tetratricopeptide repeat protein [Nodosilinea sp. LEGE 06152]|uniref:tetratricopeptide repeat protein n=1 Tax=Nodosilinea sp. LEGE 06152 TaxID=2777966 RepID=UPI00188263DA|nr:tetratricopeptide repeat protein [Nodosilinea sp. LEGE 06152]MBE9156081.1 tetratricopeptide repeat protein [Nodosilinea sp. LEGE 06152]